ncbi:hypothetical protein G3N56_02340 [Desulfovibrio sulfodismutans]|uniref:Uncharacterized protein n=1 Tax=Desulfolutivibrio sulfodismutans TaxID=63561 RepID=A0A7K3NHA6_9BACT|nr:hypothetical protein [Desulfolutivibrio sulfodismutans]NDY55584.1 hypothetical protein [Desulfolutivibrio sulfodismutans]QLA11485.1 hypothetical protein GD606_03935 [Desulfolutivibrio sulfodismutans DSM 3696]
MNPKQLIEEALAELGQVPGMGGDVTAIREAASRARNSLRRAHAILAPARPGKLLDMRQRKEVRG